jgi:hypothetical protein
MSAIDMHQSCSGVENRKGSFGKIVFALFILCGHAKLDEISVDKIVDCYT